ncbi:DUF885 domain-containing protein [Longimicrobium sp.]|uniref:DUF885 domain-containing protein n=1 Tax=Longimicrobium sp. TaxID=2029185 RepID=UPI002E3504FE|nr:DUF885 domain-containing protein [Longimicrobium sp.]HEX6037476.1 DUF885 domain-containing protein [Longimicrobium sp.]
MPTIIRVRRLVPVLAALALALPAAAQQDASERLQQLFAEEWDWRVRESPLFATSLGDPRGRDALDATGLADIERQTAENRRFLQRLRAIPRDSLSPQDRVNYDIFERGKAESIEEFELGLHLIPITNREGFHTFFPQLPDNVPLQTVADYESYIARLRAFRPWVGQHVELMREGIRRGMVLPRVSLEGIEGMLEPHLVADPTQSLLYKPFTAFPAGVPEAERARLAAAGRAAVEESVVPGYRDFLQFIQREYVPAARAGIGASELPNGRAIYAQRVRSYTTLDVTPDQVHETGLREVARIRAQMDSLIRATGFTGTFPEFIQFLRTDPRFYVQTPEALMERTSLVLKRMDGELPRLFGRLPRMSYGIRAIPDFIAPRTTTAYYSRPSGDGTRSGTYWVNTYDLPSRPTYEIEALSFHEAVPGHHLQIALQQELEGMPTFRRFTSFTAFVEGWGLYAERLGYDVGFYQDPYSRFGQLSYDMWRACRLVVDTGMHWKGWTRQQAIDFMAENSALTLLNITNEVDRYIAWPGQALGYKMGQLKISELRAEAQAALGDRFDLRRFHDVVLGSGSVPLTVLETNVRAWIAAERGREVR